MNILKYPTFWFAGHQIGLLVYSLWHLIFHLNRGMPNHVVAGFLVGFAVHCMLFVSWSLINWSTNLCVLAFAIPTGLFGWAFSLVLIVSMDHWSMPPFLIAAVIWPFFIFYKVYTWETVLLQGDAPPTASLIKQFFLLIAKLVPKKLVPRLSKKKKNQ
jgi:hypothetical protein